MKTLLQISNICKSYGALTVLDNACVTITENQKIGVIGRNGAGKSTLCKIITGDEEQDSGQIETSADYRLAYLEQHDPYQLNETVIAFLTRYTEKEAWQCGKVAARFQMKNELLNTQIAELSGGFRTRVKLTAMLLRDPNFLILDEPTNYLDLKTLILLEEFLQDYKGGFLVVSHDREFLKKTCEHTLEIEQGACTLYPGDVEKYLIFKEEQGVQIESYNKNILTKQKQLQLFVDRFRAKASKAAQAKSKMKQIERLKTIDTGHVLSNVHIKIPEVAKRNSFALRCKDLDIGYPDLTVARRTNMEFNQGSHVAILGDNGQGKTTFMRTIAGDLAVKAGEFKWGFNIEVAYYAQHVFATLDPQGDVYAHLYKMAHATVTNQDILNIAGSFLFKGEDVKKKVAVLSGGEKARLCLAGLLLTKSSILLFDEPTNHLDFETVEALGKALKKFNGTILFISHDRTFVNMLATEIVEVKDGRILHYPGNYEDYVYAMERRVRDEFADDIGKGKGKEPVKGQEPKAESKGKQGRQQLKRLKAERVQLRSKLRKLQERFERHKKERDEIHEAFTNNPDAWSLERNQRYEYLQRVIQKEESEWLDLSTQVDDLARLI